MFVDENKYIQESGFTQKWYSEEMDKVAKISDDWIKHKEVEPYTLRFDHMDIDQHNIIITSQI